MSTRSLQSRPPTESPGASIERARVEPWHDAEWQRLWLAVDGRPWRTLALIPAGDGASLDFTVFVAMTLSHTCMLHLGSSMQVADATHISLNQLNPFMNELHRITNDGTRLLVALPSVSSGAVTTTIAQSTDAAVLCVLMERMRSADAKRTVKLIGAERFLGSAVFHPQSATPHK